MENTQDNTKGKGSKLSIQELLQKRPQDLDKLLIENRTRVFERFPLLFTLLATFGFVATLYGFEGIIDSIDLFSENPFILLLAGLAMLLFTGTLYKKLGD